MALNVTSQMTKYAASRGISNAEVGDLIKKLGSHPTKEQLSQLKSARSAFGKQFSASSVAEYERYVGQFGLLGGKVKVIYAPFRKGSRRNDAKFQSKWGFSGPQSAKAPTFERAVKVSAVPGAIKSAATRFAFAFHREQYRQGQLETGTETFLRDNVGSNHEVKLDTAGKIFDRDHKAIGWIVGGTYKDGTSVEAYYRNDGKFTGMSFSLWQN